MKKNIPNIVVIFGSYPDLGKGTFMAALGYLIQKKGYSVFPIKFDGYLNASSGTMNPYHQDMDSTYAEEEVFVLKDGYEADADSGYYERFLHNEFPHESNISNGRIFGKLAKLEAEGKLRFGEVLNYRALRNLLEDWVLEVARDNAITCIEIGGTIGDKDTEIIFDCLNLVKSHQKANIFTIMLSPYLDKKSDDGSELSYRSKITRQAFEKAWRYGLMPQSIVIRSDDPKKIQESALEYIELETGLDVKKDIFTDPDLPTIYDLPKHLESQKIDLKVLSAFNLPAKKTTNNHIDKYSKLLSQKQNFKVIKLAVFGKTMSNDSYISLKEAIEHTGLDAKLNIEIEWLDNNPYWNSLLNKCQGLIVGESLRQSSEKIEALSIARKNNIPTLALSFGADLMVVEFIRNELGKIITIEELGEPNDTLSITKNKLTLGNVESNYKKSIHYKKTTFFERYRYIGKINNSVLKVLEPSELTPFILSKKGDEVLGVEHKRHPFYVGVKFHPEFISHPMYPHPLFQKLIMQMKVREENAG